jgi:hypothetical protein
MKVDEDFGLPILMGQQLLQCFVGGLERMEVDPLGTSQGSPHQTDGTIIIDQHHLWTREWNPDDRAESSANFRLKANLGTVAPEALDRPTETEPVTVSLGGHSQSRIDL